MSARTYREFLADRADRTRREPEQPLAQQQQAYSKLFRRTRPKPPRRPITIMDVNGSYPDQEWTRPD